MNTAFRVCALLNALLCSVGTSNLCGQTPGSPTKSCENECREKAVVLSFKELGLTLTGPFDVETLIPQIKSVHDWASKDKEEKTIELQSAKDPMDQAIGKLFPNRWERWGRFQQLKVEAQEQPGTILIYQSQTSSATTAIPNPDHVLFKYSVALKAAEFFPTTQDVAEQLAAYYEDPKKPNKQISAVIDVLCKDAGDPATHVASCLLKNRKRDFLYRALSGTTGLYSYSDNPQVQQNILIQSGTVVSERNRLVSGQVDFDPTNLFLSGTDWKNALTSAAYYKKEVQDSIKANLRQRCKDRKGKALRIDDPLPITEDCIMKLSGPSNWSKFAAALVPQVEYKVSTQFDFIKSGENFVQPPFPLGHLYYFSFTQDLRRAIVPAKSRADALAAIRADAKLKPIPMELDLERQTVAEEFSKLAVNPTLLNDAVWYATFIDKLRTAMLARLEATK